MNEHSDQDTRRAFQRGQRAALFVAFLALVVLRIPRAWLHGRFQDEEASVFLAYAWHHPWQDALFRPFMGYWNLAANATTLLAARLVKGDVLTLEHAPYLTMTLALAVQSLPAILILSGRAQWLEQRATVIAALLILAIAPGIEEVFFNVLHIQFHLALCVVLLLTLDAPRHAATRAGSALLLFLAPLCGPIALVFSPLFGLRALIDRDRRRWAQMALLAAGGVVQMLVFYRPNPMRSHMLDPGTILATMALRTLVMPLLGFGKAEHIGDAIARSQAMSGPGIWGMDGATIAIFGALLFMAARRRDAAIWMLLSSLLVGIVSFGFGMILVRKSAAFDMDSERYTFLPLIMFMFALIVMAMRSGSRTRPIWALMLALTLATGLSRYPRSLPSLRDGPAWPAEVAAWRRDPNHPLAVWPKPWTADLSNRTAPCPPFSTDPVQPESPRYCEGSWATSFYRAQPRAAAD